MFGSGRNCYSTYSGKQEPWLPFTSLAALCWGPVNKRDPKTARGVYTFSQQSNPFVRHRSPEGNVGQRVAEPGRGSSKGSIRQKIAELGANANPETQRNSDFTLSQAELMKKILNR